MATTWFFGTLICSDTVTVFDHAIISFDIKVTANTNTDRNTKTVPIPKSISETPSDMSPSINLYRKVRPCHLSTNGDEYSRKTKQLFLTLIFNIMPTTHPWPNWIRHQSTKLGITGSNPVGCAISFNKVQ